MSVKYPKFPVAVILGSIGWLLVLYPQFLNLSHLIVTGQLDMLGMVIGPLASALALLTMFGEVAGHWDAKARRAASFIAAVFLLASAAAVLWQGFLNQGLAPTGTSVAVGRAGAILNSMFLCSWALLFGVFAGTTAPFRRRFTHAIAGLIAIEVAFFVVLFLYDLWGHGHRSHLLANTMTVSPYALMLVFLLVARREGATPCNAD